MATRSSLMDFQTPKIVSEDADERSGRFTIEPLDRGFGYTFGNSLRRVLLSSLEGRQSRPSRSRASRTSSRRCRAFARTSPTSS